MFPRRLDNLAGSPERSDDPSGHVQQLKGVISMSEGGGNLAERVNGDRKK